MNIRESPILIGRQISKHVIGLISPGYELGRFEYGLASKLPVWLAKIWTQFPLPALCAGIGQCQCLNEGSRMSRC